MSNVDAQGNHHAPAGVTGPGRFVAQQLNEPEWVSDRSAQTSSICFECGNTMVILEGGVSHHTFSDGGIDHDQDADHVAYEEVDDQGDSESGHGGGSPAPAAKKSTVKPVKAAPGQPGNYDDILKSGKSTGASKATDAELMAMFCATSIQTLCGAVSPKMVWEGAQKKGMTSSELAKLATTNPRAVEDLMWL